MMGGILIREEYEDIKDASSVIMDARETSVELTV